MSKQLRQYLRRSLCGMLSAAMIATSLIVPNMTVYAAPEDDEASITSVTTENEDDMLVDETTGENETGDENKGSGLEGDDENVDDGDEEGSSEIGDNVDEDDEEKPDGEGEENLNGDLTDDEEDGIDEDIKSDDEEEPVTMKDDVSVMALEGSRAGYGELVNGDFSEWDGSVPKAWKLTPAYDGKNDFKVNTIDEKHGEYKTLYIYKATETNISVSQVISNMKPGAYLLTLDAGGVYSKDQINLKVETVEKSDEDDQEDDQAYSTVTGELTTESLGECDGWGKWNPIETEVFKVEIPSGKAEVNVKVTISGKIGVGNKAEQFYLDDVKFITYTLSDLNALLVEAGKKQKDDYTETSWSAFEGEKSVAQSLVNDSATTDETKAYEILTAYVALKKAMDALQPSAVNLYYYAGETDDEIGLYYWDDSTDKTNLTSTAEKATWYVWGAGDTYKMTKVDDYTGWYSIPLTFKNSGESTGFQIFKKSVAELENGDEKKVAEYVCEAKNGDTDFFGKITSGEANVYAVKSGKGYAGDMAASIVRQVTLHVYNAANTPYLQMGGAIATSLSVVDETNKTLTPLEAVTAADNNAYELQAEKYKNWYSITFAAPGKLKFDNSEKIGNLYEKDSTGKYEWVKDFVNGVPEETNKGWQDDFTPVFAGDTYYKDGKFYKTLEEADPAALKTPIDLLRELVEKEKAKERKKEDYVSGWEEFQTALEEAEAVIKRADDPAEGEEEPTDDEIEKATEKLKAAIANLVYTSVDAELNVERVPLSDDFITGADLSSYIAVKDSGVEFKNEDGKPLTDAEFFQYLADGGTNWVRIRVWNDPYNSSGKGYGGGNNDLEKAKTLGKLATNAGMRVLIDFHYSDFWADPGKQDAPKAWKAYTVDQKVDAVYNYTLASLNELKAAGVDVGMVQVGNETNNGICGEKTTANMIKIFNAGCDAVHEFNKDCLAAIHFTNPEKGRYSSIANDFSTVRYDVFASSYYPFWHGTTAKLTEELTKVAATGKKVMVAETSWVTTWDDGDGHENTAPRLGQDLNYDISVQGQADEIHAVVAAANAVNDAVADSAIGVFYWEPAWISPYYVYDEDGNRDDNLYKKNQTLWEQYGSGWASSYAADYDPDDAGKWYGGSAIDNQAWFDFDGTALPTAKIYSLIRTGAKVNEADKAVASVESNITCEIKLGETFDYPTVKVKYNTGETEEAKVDWDPDEQKQVNTDKVGEYVVHGTISKDGKEYKVTLTIKVIRSENSNILVNPGFEDDGDNVTTHTGWAIDPATGSAVNTKPSDWKANPKSGTYAMNFYFASKGTFTVSQTIEKPEAGTYSFGGYIQGGEADTEDVQYIFAEVRGKDNSLKSRKQASCTLDGWLNWSEPEITGITVSDGDKIIVGAIIESTKNGAWGSMDDFYLYGTHSVTTAECENGTVAASVLKANSGEKVGITVTPDSGYYVKTLTLSGASIADTTIISSSINGCTAEFKAASGDAKNAVVLSYPEGTAAISESFTMPNGNVEVSATFASVFSGAKISLDAKDGNSKYLVQVNGSDEENPIEAQWYTGKNVTPTVELSYKGYKLTSQDYSVTYTNNKNTSDGATIKLTGKGDRFEGERTITFTIKPETRSDFSKLKVTFLNPDKGDGSAPAKSTYYLGKQKELKPEIVLKDSDGKEIANPKDKPIYKVFYYNNKKLGKATVVVLPTEEGLHSYKEGSVTTTFTIAKCPINNDNVTVTISQPNQYYTGKKVEPAVSVTLKYKDSNGNEKTATLSKGTDYSITYGNNVNATKPNKPATIKITGKGNFTGTRTTYDLTNTGKPGSSKITFEIKQRSITNATITAADLVQSAKGAAPKLTVKDGTKTLASSQYVITKIVKEGDTEPVFTYDQASETKYVVPKLKDAGKYEITVAGKSTGNYNGEKTAQFDVKDKAHLISNAKITISGKFYFTGSAIRLNTTAPEGATPGLKVVAGSGIDAKTLTDGTDYTVTYENNVNAGKATVTITGKGDYVGKKTATFAIGKRTLVTEFKNDNEKVTKGKFQTPTLSAKNIKTKLDGIWTPDSEDSETTGKLFDRDTGKTGTLSIPYTGYTLNPELTFSSDNNSGTPRGLSSSDYTVTYSVGKWVETKDETGKVVAKTAPVTATVKGKGNYSGSVKLENLFTLTARELKEFNIEVSEASHNVGKAVKPSVTFSKKADGTVVDLKLGTAYTVAYKNNKLAAMLGIAKNEPTVTVKVKGNGWITDKNDKTTTQYVKTFNIDQQEIVEANVADIAIQTYKGKALTPAVTVKVNGKKLKAGTDYTVTYSNNVKRTSDTTIGTVKITGKGNYFTRKPIEKTFIIK